MASLYELKGRLSDEGNVALNEVSGEADATERCNEHNQGLE
jgi:hypothetical protein